MVTNHNATFEVVGLVRFAQVPKWLIRHPDLSPGAKTLYADIMSYADNDTKAAFPSRQTLAKDLNVSVRSITNYIHELEAVGAVTVTRGRKNKRTGNYYANHYVLHWENPGAKNVLPAGAKNVPLTTPTMLPTLTVNPDAVTSVSDDLSPTPVVETTTDHSLQRQLWISKEEKDRLVDVAVDLFSQGIDSWDDDRWADYAEQIEDATGVFVGDNIANKRFDERLSEVVTQHWGKGPRYGASVWLGTLVNTARVGA